MPGSYTFEGDLMSLVFQGDSTAEEIEALVNRAFDDPGCPARVELLVDNRESTSIARTSMPELRRMVDAFHPHRSRIRRRAVVTTPGVRYGMMRMASAIAETGGSDVRLFTDTTTARAWLSSDGEDGGPVSRPG